MDATKAVNESDDDDPDALPLAAELSMVDWRVELRGGRFLLVLPLGMLTGGKIGQIIEQ